MKHLILFALPLALAACAESAGPRSVSIASTPTPFLVVEGMNAQATLESAQRTAQAVDAKRVQETEDARRVIETRQAHFTETFAVKTLEAADREATSTVVVLKAAELALTPTAIANANAQATATQADRTAKTQTARTEADAEAQRAQTAKARQEEANRQAANLAWWAGFWGMVGDAVWILVIAIAAIVGVIVLVAGVTFIVYIIAFAATRMKREQGQTFKDSLIRDSLGNQWWYDAENRRWLKVVEGRVLPPPPKLPEPAEEIPVNQNGKPALPIKRNPPGTGNESQIALTLAFLRDTLAYLQINPNWEMTRLPGWRELCELDPPDTKPKRWSGTKWTRAIAPLRRYLSSSGTNIYLAKNGRFETWEELMGSIERTKSFV